jgi:hypothetical protein
VRRRAAKVEKEDVTKSESTQLEKSKSPPESRLTASRSSVEQVKAIAAKISAARRLARKLAEEKAAVAAVTDGDPQEAELYAASFTFLH